MRLEIPQGREHVKNSTNVRTIEEDYFNLPTRSQRFFAKNDA